MNIVIVGARERKMVTKDSREPTAEDKQLVEDLLKNLSKRHGRRLHAISVGCDRGIGKTVRDFCIANKIIFTENRMKLEGEDIPKSTFIQVFLARNASLLELGDEFYIFKGPYESGIIESLIEPAKKKVGDQRVVVYDYKEN
jgi:hypothetical protein